MTRTVPANTPMIAFEHGQYSVPHTLVGQTVWVRRHGEQIVIVHVGLPARSRSPATSRPRRAPRGSSTRISRRRPKGRWSGLRVRKLLPRQQFLALGDGAGLWLTEAAATGRPQVRAKMAEAVELAGLHDDAAVDRALGQAATAGRFGHGDLAAILAHQADRTLPSPAGRAGEDNSLAQGTAGWAGLGDPDLGQTGFGETEVTR